MKKMKKALCLMASILMIASFCGCDDLELTETESEPVSTDESKEMLTNAQTLSFNYSSSSPSQKTDIKADGVKAGKMTEEGLFNVTWTVSIDDENWFYAKFVTDEPINDVEGVISATTYGAYDAEGNLLGYAQQQVIEPAGKARDYYMVFLDADGNAKPYYSNEKGSVLWDYDGNVLAQGTSSIGILGSTIDIKTEDGVNVSIDPWDRIFMYIRVLDDLSDSLN